ncbi:ACR3 family arsenite efflux transporter [Thalassospira indica]|uniref:Arsenical-resistance protein n=1 Tax=Thalassospira indica TaxID=1891279 RepID=A0ABM6Y2X0_9PROT|nr:ACR3 family arsenite efflux transporter [Thalassospira indica]AXO16286.1 arsenical-resistance protein [Thalassospira indica]OAZ13775.1 arsenic transporter [Thalassospira profundimaris]
MGIFERFLTIWVAVSIVVGIVLGEMFPSVFQAIGNLTAYEINLPVTVLIWLMIVPMLMKVDFGALHEVGRQWRGIGVTLGVNWLIKPFTMVALGWLFIGFLFRPLLPEAQIESYIAGLILLGAAPCTAMVFVWSHLTKGDANFTLTQVALNDTIMIFAFAPIVALLLGISAITIPWETLTISVVAFIVIPVIAGQIIRNRVMKGGIAAFNNFDAKLKPVSMIALLSTLVLLFAFQGQQIIAQPMIIALLAVPIILQTYFIAAIAYLANKVLGVEHKIAAPSSMIGASNFFELAVATAIGLFGFSSGAALATVVGVLVEVPVMLSLVAIANRTRGWFTPSKIAN